MVCFNDLPDEIILIIFKFYLEDNSQNDLLKLADVCQLWKAISQSSDLWIKFDGSVSYETMKHLVLQGYLESTKELKISKVESLPDKDAERFFTELRNVEAINFSRVESFSTNVISMLAECPLKLKEIEIGYKKEIDSEDKGQIKKEPTIKYFEFQRFLTSKGEYLTTIKVSFCRIQNAVQFLKCISICCPNLEHLNFTNNSCVVNFPLKHFQTNCPKLKILHLDYNTPIENLGRHSLGFPNLEVFTYNDLNSFSHLRDKNLEYILFNSPNLKFLNLLNCSVSVEVLCSLPAHSLEYLFLSRSKVASSFNLSDVFKKWCYTLKQVDISYVSNVSINNAIDILTHLPTQPPIEFLDVSYTQINSNAVKKILEKCKQLGALNLTGCRNLSRGLKRSYSGKKELEGLYARLRDIAYDESTDEEMFI